MSISSKSRYSGVQLHTGWDVAHLVMHGAFDELKAAYDVARVGVVEVDKIDPISCFSLGSNVDARNRVLRRYLVKVVTLFQAGMESIISHWGAKYPEIAGGKGFVAKWEHAFSAKGQPPEFAKYADFYRQVRNAIVHPDSANKIAVIDALQFSLVYDGVQSGWIAFRRLGAAIGEPHDDDSWDIMCTAHDLPPELKRDELPDLSALRVALFERHLDELNAQIAKRRQ